MSNIIQIQDLQIPQLDLYARLSEVQLLRYYEPEEGIFIAESPKVIARALDAGCVPISALVEDKQIENEAKEILKRCGSIPVYTGSYSLPKVIARALDAGCVPISALVEDKQIENEAKEILKRCGSIPVYTGSYSLLCGLTGFPLTRGMLCAMRRPPLPSMEEICMGAKRIAVLEDYADLRVSLLQEECCALCAARHFLLWKKFVWEQKGLQFWKMW